MKTILAIMVGLSLTVAAPHRVSGQEPLSGKVLVLDNDRTLEGDIDRVDNQYRVRRSVGITWVPAERVLHLCKDRIDALTYLRKRANLQDPDERLRLARWCHLQGLRDEALKEVRAAVELRPDDADSQRLARYLDQAVRQPSVSEKATPSTPARAVAAKELPPITINADSLTQFATRVQPILMNACARCHAAAGHESAFLLERSNTAGLANRRAVHANLTSVLAQLHARRPERSPLLVKAISAHGAISDAPLKGRQVEAFNVLEDWVRVTLANNPQLNDAIKPPLELLAKSGTDPKKGRTPQQKAKKPDSVPSPKPTVEEPHSDGSPESEFDPIFFNRQMHPDRFSPARTPAPRKDS